MARPETIADVKDRIEEVGAVDVGNFITSPNVLKAWAAFAETVTKAGGEIRRHSYEKGKAELWMPRDEKQLRDQLRTEQYTWDQNQKVYDICIINHTPPENWQKDSIKAWALAEGLPIVWETPRDDSDPRLAELREKIAR